MDSPPSNREADCITTNEIGLSNNDFFLVSDINPYWYSVL